MELTLPTRRLSQPLAAAILRLLSWKLDVNLPSVDKYVVIGAPHTSNWDFLFFLLLVHATGIKLNFVAKDSLFRWPLGGVMRRLGGIPVTRRVKNNFVNQMIAEYKRRQQLAITIAPEGTRGKTEYWRTGFYYIALGAKIPIFLGFIDYRNKVVGIGPSLSPSGDIQSDFTFIRKFYATKIGRHPDLQGNVKVRPKILIFDFDGVLADTLEDMLDFAREGCAQMGYPCRPTQEDLNSLEHMSFEAYARQLGIPEERISEFTTHMFQLFTSRQQPPDIFPGLKHVVLRLARQARIGIVTGNTSRLVYEFLDYHDLASEIDIVIAVEEPGTRSEKIQTAARRLSGIGSQVFVIGDAVSDIYAARDSGTKSIAVTWGHQSQEKLALSSPDYMVHSPEELLLVLSHTEDLSSKRDTTYTHQK